MSDCEWLALAWVLIGVGAGFWAFVDAVEDGREAERVVRQAGASTIIAAVLIAAAGGPLTAWVLRHRL